MASLVEDDLARARSELNTAMSYLRLSSTTAPSPFRGLWALLQSVADIDGSAAREEIRSSGVCVLRMNRAYLEYAEAVAVGRAGAFDEAEAVFAAGDANASHGPWWQQHARRVVAEAALQDGWGDPRAWLAVRGRSGQRAS
jgi:hypothetical protein